MPIPKPTSCPELLSQGTHSLTHLQRHLDSLQSGVGYWNWVVENDHDPVTCIALESAIVLDDDFANGCVVVAQQRHHVFRIRDFSEPGEATQITEERRDLTPMTFELLLCSRRNDQIGDLRRQKASESTYPLYFVET